MCCILTSLALLGPRAAILIWWLFQPTRWEAAFSSFWWSFLGFIFLPWTTLAWVAVWSPTGVTGFDYVILGLGVLIDISQWTGGAYGNRDRVPGYAT